MFAPYLDSTHSSPRSYPADLDSYYPHLVHSQTYPIPHYRRPPSYGYGTAPLSTPVSLQVSTSTSSHEHDPNERTARPGNAHHHMEFHTALGASTLADHSDNSAVKSEFPPTRTLTTTNGGHNLTGSISIGIADNGGVPSNSTAKDYTSSTPGLTGGLTRPLKPIERERLAHLDRLKFFLATAPSRWDDAAENAAPTPSLTSMGEGADELVSTPTPPSQPFMSGTVPYGPASFTSSYPSGPQYAPLESSSNTRNTFAPQALSDSMHQQHLSHLRAPPHPALNRFLLPNQEFVTCVLWNGLYHISGTDIVRALVFRFEVSLKKDFPEHNLFVFFYE